MQNKYKMAIEAARLSETNLERAIEMRFQQKINLAQIINKERARTGLSMREVGELLLTYNIAPSTIFAASNPSRKVHPAINTMIKILEILARQPSKS